MANYAYIRVSTDAQDLNSQRHGVIEYACRLGFDKQGLVFFDETASGRKSWKERDISKLIEQAKEGDVLIVSEVSRLARSTKQVLDILEVAAEKGLMVHFAKENLAMDGSMMSHIVATVFALVAQIETSFISRRTTEALAKRKAEGKRLGRPPGAVSVEKKLDKHKDEILDLLKKGVQKTAIAKIVDCSPDTLYRWMEENGLGAYIKSRKEKQAPKKGEVPVDSGKKRRDGKGKVKG